MRRTVLTFTTADALRCRFVRSLLWETLHAVRTLVDPPQQRFHASWLATIDPCAARKDLPVLLALNPRRGWVPDFLAPPPRAARRTFEDELAEVAAGLCADAIAARGPRTTDRPARHGPRCYRRRAGARLDDDRRTVLDVAARTYRRRHHLPDCRARPRRLGPGAR
jgi:hypothetical protein